MPIPRAPLARPAALLALLALAGCPESGIQIKPLPDDPPIVQITLPADGFVVDEGSQVRLEGTLLDDRDAAEDLTITVYAGDDVICEDLALAIDLDEERSATFACTWTATPGVTSLRVAAADSSTVDGQDSVSIEVTPSDAPTVTLIAPTADGGPYFADTLIGFELQIADAEDAAGDLIVAWSDNDDALSMSGAGTDGADGRWTGSASLSPGLHALRATVTDSSGKSGSATVNLEVFGENTDPDCAITAPEDGGSFELGDTITIAGTASDAETASSSLTATLSSSRGDALPDAIIDASGGFSALAEGLSPGAHTLTLRVEDGWGGLCVDTTSIEVCGAGYYEDNDGDGFGDDSRPISACTPPAGAVTVAGDCDDADPFTFPGAAPSEADPDLCRTDADLDGWGDDRTTSAIAAGTDCDDDAATTSPDAAEACDGIDNDCDGALDEDDATDAITYYTDADRDGAGDPATAARACTVPAGAVLTATDCDDSTALRAPGRPETCDGLDNDCDRVVDPTTSTDAGTYYRDQDGDTYGDAAATTRACAAPAGYVSRALDCNDVVAAVNPAAAELCDGDDNDCDGNTDEAAVDALTFYRDQDSDSFGDPTLTTAACAAPAGYVARALDCDDTRTAVNPAAVEVCNSIDDDCNEGVDEASAADAGTYYTDADGDTYGAIGSGARSCAAPPGSVTRAGDCDDARIGVNPGAAELCDSRDNDCDGALDEADATDALTWYADTDGDTYGSSTSTRACTAPSGHASRTGDCDDALAAVNPAATETCNGRDDDCNDGADEASATDALTWYADTDGDTYGSSTSTRACSAPAAHVSRTGDCDDTRGAVNPAATELCDGLNNDCDATTDEADAADALTWYDDDDGDTYGDPSDSTRACSAPSGYVSRALDCDDVRAAVNPAATEVCDSRDNDCDGTADETDAADALTWYADADGDTYGSSTTARACTAPSGYVSRTGDCDDALAAVNPAAAELCNGRDDDCNEGADEASASDAPTWYADADADTYGSSVSARACSAPSGHVSRTGDCNDALAAVNPAATELCNGRDDDCNEGADEASASDAPTWYADADADTYGSSMSTRACSAPSGYVSRTGDCDDGNALRAPSLSEICDGLDNDCNSSVDPSTAVDALTWYADDDGDSYGDAADTERACSVPVGHVANATDCDDTRLAVYPGATERCNGRDDDCDSISDEPSAVDASTWYADTDGDSYGDPESVSVACSAPVGSVADDTDCEPTEGEAYPGSTSWEHISDGVDQDCDGLDGCEDLDCDDIPDMVLLGGYDGDYVTQTTVYFGGDGFAESSRLVIPGNAVYSGASADLDGDGFKELILGNFQDSSTYYKTVDIHWGSITGPSTTPAVRLPAAGVFDIKVDDLDVDGYPDIVVANRIIDNADTAAPYSYVYWGTAAGYSTADRTDIPTTAPVLTQAADLDGDGDKDLIFCNYRNGTDYFLNSMVYYLTSAGYTTASRNLLTTYGCNDIDVADFNRDGRPDILFTNHYTNTSYFTDSFIYYGTASGYSSGSRVGLPTAGAYQAAVGDVNNDGQLDVLFGSFISRASYPTARSYLYYGSPTGPSSASRLALAEDGVVDVALADIDGNGFLDMIFGRHTTHTSSPYNTTSGISWGTAAGFLTYTSVGTYSPVTVLVGDLDTDGVADLAFPGYRSNTSFATGYTHIYYGIEGSATVSSVQSLNSGGGVQYAFLVGDTSY
jgi:hypothetical protein